jgi:hypothetical protein
MHFHSYIYKATHGERPRWDTNQLDPEGSLFSTSPFPPSFVAHWLRKPSSFIQETFNEAEEATKWASKTLLGAYGGEKTSGSPIGRLVEFGTDCLNRGKDICWSNDGAIGHTYTEVYVICCPNEGGTARCPIGRQDTRPEGACKMTGIP